MIGMPSALAFSNLDPASAPTTRAVVFFETLSATCPPAASISSAAFVRESDGRVPVTTYVCPASGPFPSVTVGSRSEEHTSELQSRLHLVCRLLLEKKKKTND